MYASSAFSGYMMVQFLSMYLNAYKADIPARESIFW